jgi:Zn-finger nucleic acid-binding protein
MSYRDELTAAAARIEALERELSAASRERDVLRAERDALRAECVRLRAERDRPTDAVTPAPTSSAALRSSARRPGQPSERCPACGRGSLEPAQLGALGTLECCRSCGGLWANAAALGELLEAAAGGVLGFEPREVDLLWEGEQTPARPSYLRCPQCAEMMVRRAHTGAKVVLDVCTAHGLWLDRGELPRLLEQQRAGFSANPLQPPSLDFGAEARPARGVESLLAPSKSEAVLDWMGSLLTTKIRVGYGGIW